MTRSILYRSPAWALLIAILLISACSPQSDKDAAASSQAADLSADLDPAFQAAFGAPAPAAHEIERGGQKVSLQYTPQRLTELSDGDLALVSTAVWPDGCPKCGGAVAVHYLQRAGAAFHVIGAWYDLGPSGSFGDAPDARIRQELFDHPVLQAEVAARATGCDMTFATLYELEPSGPVLRAKDILTMRNNIPMGAMRMNLLADFYGNILADKKGKSFKVHYHGTTQGDVSYAAGPGGVWKATSGPKLPEC